MVRTHGLTHIALLVKDPERSLRFYKALLGVRVTWSGDGTIEAQTPGAKDFITLERAAKGTRTGRSGSIEHFGFRLRAAKDIDAAIDAARRGGGTLLRRGEFSPGHPFAYVEDPDGYEIELWYE